MHSIGEEIQNRHGKKQMHIKFFPEPSCLSCGTCSISLMSHSWRSSLCHGGALPQLMGVVKVTEAAAFFGPHSGLDSMPVSSGWLWATWRSCRVGGRAGGMSGAALEADLGLIGRLKPASLCTSISGRRTAGLRA